jgi:hypothetical protein
MPLYATNQPFTLSTTVTNVGTGLPADPGALTLAYVNVAPGSAAVTKNWPAPADITKDSVGNFHYDVPAGLTAGHYRDTWTATGANAGVDSDVFDIFDPAAYPRIVSFTDAKDFVRALGTADDALLDRMVGWASARILREVVAYNSTYTQTVTARGGALNLSRCPVRSVTAATPLETWAYPVTVSDLYVKIPLGGVVRSKSGQPIYGTYEVTYTAGPDEVPPGVDGACLQLIQHWWNQSQAHGSATYGDAGFVPDFAGLPNAVKNMLAVVPKAPLIA